MISKDMLGCTNARTKGTCDNRLNIRRDTLEQSVLNGLDKHLMEPEFCKEFCDEFTREVNKARMEARVSIDAAQTETKRIDRELEKILDLYLKDAMPVDMVKERSTKLEARKKELASFLDGTEEPPPLLHPNLAKYYHKEIAALHDQLGNEEMRAMAADKLRTLVSRIDLVPDGAELVIVLRGDLAAILTFASGKRKPDFLNEQAILEKLMGRAGAIEGQKHKKPHEGALLLSQGCLVAGAGFEPAAFRL
ncbi:hypothetical protein [Pararhizobium gei]|uniref:hypothetical protein n=1 Tax=Pararhizobium gei TaxID=1395951 RepID=UPI003312FC3F